MSAAINFLNEKAPDNQGRYLSNYYKFTPFEWEAYHDVIQWAFPTKTESRYNSDAPIIPDDFNYTADNQRTILLLLSGYLESIGLRILGDNSKLFFDYMDNFYRYSSWIHKSNHNYKRLTRVIECLGLFGLKDEQNALVDFLLYDLAIKYRDDISADTVVYWVATWQNTRDKLKT
jgi:hypothetical protein